MTTKAKQARPVKIYEPDYIYFERLRAKHIDESGAFFSFPRVIQEVVKDHREFRKAKYPRI